MLLTLKLKSFIERIPYPVGRILSLVPFPWRLGREYARGKKQIEAFNNGENSEEYSVCHFRQIFEYARDTFPSYRGLYERNGVWNLKIESLEDIQKVPIIDKQWTRTHFAEFTGAYRLNTGGSSGEPTAFWMDRDCWAREWAHMHTIWGKMGYKYTDLKLAIRGRNLGETPFVYNPVHNEYIINTYLNVTDYARQIHKLFGRRKIRWFHGYPSSIHQFIVECEAAFGKDETLKLFRNVRGLLLSSEFPHPNIVAKFKEYNLPFVSWYGHSEMCILAYDDSAAHGGEFANHYKPFPTYGYCEVVGGHLIGTSFHNTDMPLIRYDTGDLVEALPDGAFSVEEGRDGDFIVDRKGKRLPLTALIFGRHHPVFDCADAVQIRQDEPGEAILYVTGLKSVNKDVSALFDFSNVDVDFKFELIDKPIRTALGKMRLRLQ